MSAPLNPPSFPEANATLFSDQGDKILQKINNNCGGASKAADVTPANGADLPNPGRIFIGSTSGGAAVKVDTFGGQTVTFATVIAGTMLPVAVRRVYSTGTTATNLIVVY